MRTPAAGGGLREAGGSRRPSLAGHRGCRELSAWLLPGVSRGEGRVPVTSMGHAPSWDPRAALCSISAAAGAPAGILGPS